MIKKDRKDRETEKIDSGREKERKREEMKTERETYRHR